VAKYRFKKKKKLLDVASGMIRTQFSKILLNKIYENKKMFNDPSILLATL
jgi:hypothetical protein